MTTDPDFDGLEDSITTKNHFLDHLSQFTLVHEDEVAYDIKEAIERYVQDHPEEAQKLIWYLIQLDEDLGLELIPTDPDEPS